MPVRARHLTRRAAPLWLAPVCTLACSVAAWGATPAAAARKAIAPTRLADCGGGRGALARALVAITQEEPVARAHWGVAVSEMDGRCLAQVDAHQLFHPASTAKLFTTAAAMSRLGAAGTVTTRLEARGVLEPAPQHATAGTTMPAMPGGRVLHGELALVGAGDGALGSDSVPFQARTAVAGELPSTAAGADQANGAMARVLTRLADAVTAAGIAGVDGDVVGDDTAFPWQPYPEDWAQDDLLWGYGAPVSALTLHDNQLAVVIRPGAEVGGAGMVEVEGSAPLRVEASDLKTGPANGGTHVEIEALPGDAGGVRVWGAIALDARAVREQVAVRDPALFAAEQLRAVLVARGVQVTGVARAEHRLVRATMPFRDQVREVLAPSAGLPACVAVSVSLCGRESSTAQAGGTSPGPLEQPSPGQQIPAERASSGAAQLLAEVPSPTVAEDVLATNKESRNLHAELLLLRLGLNFGEQSTRVDADGRVLIDAGSRAQGVRVVRSVLGEAGVDPDEVVLVDGSGLSTHDLVSPAAAVRLLLWSGAQPWFPGWEATLPVGGVDGTLASRFVAGPLRGRVLAKTGTLGESRALAGYLRCKSGKIVAFAVMVDGHAPGQTADREAMDRLVEAIYRAE